LSLRRCGRGKDAGIFFRRSQPAAFSQSAAFTPSEAEPFPPRGSLRMPLARIENLFPPLPVGRAAPPRRPPHNGGLRPDPGQAGMGSPWQCGEGAERGTGIPSPPVRGSQTPLPPPLAFPYKHDPGAGVPAGPRHPVRCACFGAVVLFRGDSLARVCVCERGRGSRVVSTFWGDRGYLHVCHMRFFRGGGVGRFGGVYVVFCV